MQTISYFHKPYFTQISVLFLFALDNHQVSQLESNVQGKTSVWTSVSTGARPRIAQQRNDASRWDDLSDSLAPTRRGVTVTLHLVL